MTDAYLSKDREHLRRMQRKRRAGMARIDYMPGTEALAIIEAKRATLRAGSVDATNSAILDHIVCEWAGLVGKKDAPFEAPMASASHAGVSTPFRAGANDFGADLPTWAESWLAGIKAKQAARRVVCGARTQTGRPCRAMSVPGKRRCKWHGGCSTGPRTIEGKARALANLKQYP